GDNRPDLAVANFYSGTVTILRGRGDGTFESRGNYVASGVSRIGTVSLAVADFDGDRKQDLAVVSRGDVAYVLLGNGDATFQPAQVFPAGPGASAVVVGDFNRDGVPDLAVANEDANSVTVLLGLGDGTFRSIPNFRLTGLGPSFIVTGDFNRDGAADLAVANAVSNNVSILINTTPQP